MRSLTAGIIMACVIPAHAGAASHGEVAGPGLPDSVFSGDADGGDVVSYTSGYFDRFQPHTALDMVRQVPGFQLDEMEDPARGFAGVAGNLLINDRRPSAKQDLPSAILARIPANNVARIELIRGQVRGIDLRGRSSMVNVILREDTAAAVRWEAALLVPFKHGPPTPDLSVSLTDSRGAVEYAAGLTLDKNAFGRSGADELLDPGGALAERRIDERENRVTVLRGNFNAATRLGGGTLIKLNTTLANEARDQFLVSNRVPQAADGTAHDETFEENFDKPIIEVGLDAERALLDALLGKAILLVYHADDASYKSQRIFDQAGGQASFRLAEGNAVSTEVITRLEFDWTGLARHVIQVNLEGAYNNLDGSLVQTLDTGGGPAVIDVPGANSSVKEVRWDVLLQDTWSRGRYELDLGLGAEASTLTQTGDADQERSFFFLKPQASLNYTPGRGTQTRLRAAREVSQLILTDFVSATVFEDNDLALGNPDLQPETTWLAELSHERRLGSISVVRLRAFHHWITDVLDLLPVTAVFETPGNIGDGRRWGAELESTLPLGFMGLAGSRLDLKLRWQDSTVVDPVTGADRVLSGPGGDFPILYDVENEWSLGLDYRQDFEAARMAWGFDMTTRAKRPVYKVNEYEVNDEDIDLNMFVETSRWLGVKMRLYAQNVFDSTGTRDRTVYAGLRGFSPVRFQELRARDRDRSVTLILSGVF